MKGVPATEVHDTRNVEADKSPKNITREPAKNLRVLSDLGAPREGTIPAEPEEMGPDLSWRWLWVDDDHELSLNLCILCRFIELFFFLS